MIHVPHHILLAHVDTPCLDRLACTYTCGAIFLPSAETVKFFLPVSHHCNPQAAWSFGATPLQPTGCVEVWWHVTWQRETQVAFTTITPRVPSPPWPSSVPPAVSPGCNAAMHLYSPRRLSAFGGRIRAGRLGASRGKHSLLRTCCAACKISCRSVDKGVPKQTRDNTWNSQKLRWEFMGLP